MCRTDVTSPQTVTVAQKTLLQLSRYTQVLPESMCAPFGICQDGIGLAIGITRSHASLELGRLIRTGSVEVWFAHIPHVKNRRMVYTLTMKGMQEAKEIRRNLLRIGIEDVDAFLKSHEKPQTGPYEFQSEVKKELEEALHKLETFDRMRMEAADCNVVSRHLLNAIGILLRGNQ